MQSNASLVWRNRLTKAGTYVFLTLLALLVLFPTVWIVGQSFMPEELILKWPIHVLPPEPTLDNFDEILNTKLSKQELSVLRWMFNSVYVTAVSTFGVLMVTSMAGYAFARCASRASSCYSSAWARPSSFPASCC